MCSIFITNKTFEDKEQFLELLEFRGPDLHREININSVSIIHYLLSMTGDTTPQPIVDGDIVCLFNGEIYNYLEEKQYKSDVYKIIDSYKDHGEDFVKKLDGEFAIVLIDFAKNCLYMSTDIFGIKPLYFSIENDKFTICTYRKVLANLGCGNITKCEPNSLYKLDIEDGNIQKLSNVYNFDLKQHKNNFDDWTAAFLSAIKKRFFGTKWDIILPLSSGHDSGAIACAFNILNIEYSSFSFTHNENKNIIEDRLTKNMENLCSPGLIHLSNAALHHDERAAARKILMDRADFFTYGKDLNYHDHIHNGYDDPGAHGLTHILNFIKTINPRTRILASGQGGDEITTNLQSYKFDKPNPEYFPSDLTKVFPWNNFFYGAQSSYLLKEESVAGAFGIEGRYPFLDKMVVQEFLWLHEDLKNRYYKSPITNFLIENNYPHSSGDPKQFKRGFNV